MALAFSQGWSFGTLCLAMPLQAAADCTQRASEAQCLEAQGLGRGGSAWWIRHYLEEWGLLWSYWGGWILATLRARFLSGKTDKFGPVCTPTTLLCLFVQLVSALLALVLRIIVNEMNLCLLPSSVCDCVVLEKLVPVTI